MAMSNRERVGRAFELLAAGLGPYVDARMQATSKHGERRFVSGAIESGTARLSARWAWTNEHGGPRRGTPHARFLVP